MQTQSARRQHGQWLSLGRLIAQANKIYRDSSLTEFSQDTKLDELTRGRPDYHLSRVTNWDLHERNANYSPAEVLDYALAGLSSSNPALVESTWTIATQVTFEWLRRNNRRPVYPRNNWNELAVLLQHPPALYALGNREQAVLMILARKAAADIRDYVAIFIEEYGKPKVSVSILGKQLDQIIDHLKIAWPKYVIGGVFSFSKIAEQTKSARTYGRCVPWRTEHYRTRLALALDAACQEIWRIIDEDSHDFDSLRSVLTKAAGLSKTAWRLIHDSRISLEMKVKDTDDVEQQSAYETVQGLWLREQALLKSAAHLLSITGNHGEAAVLAAGALISPLRAETSPRTRHRSAGNRSDDEVIEIDNSDPTRFIASGARVFQLPAFGIVPQWPSCATAYWRKDPSHQEAYAAARASLNPPFEGRGEGFVDTVCLQPKEYSPVLRNAAFELALDQGRPYVAFRIATGIPKNFVSYRRSSRFPISLTKIQFLRVTCQISSFLQHTALVANVGQQGALLTLFRRAWRDFFEDSSRLDLAADEVLFIHEVRRGLLEPVLQTFHSPNELLEMRYEDRLIEQRQRALFDIATRRSFDEQTTTLGIAELQHLMIPNDAAFVSLAIRDGHELSVIVVPSGSTRPVDESVISVKTVPTKSFEEPTNWADLAEEINLWSGYWATQDRLPIPWPKAFIELCEGLIREVLRTNPQCHAIYVAMDECLRGLPWQHLIGVRLKQFTDDFRRGLGVSNASPPLLICHVPSAYHFCATLRQRTPLRRPNREITTWKVDDSDPMLVELAESLKQVRMEQSNKRDFNLITILAHGLRSSEMVGIVFDGDKSDRSELLEKCSAADIVLFHVCNAGFFSDASHGDLGGLPGMLISFGVKAVVAPVAPVAKSVVCKFEQYISAWLANENKTFLEMYADAVLECPAIGLYSVFGDPGDLV